MTLSNPLDARATLDWARRPLPIVLWWIAPFVLAEASDGFGLRLSVVALVWSAAMGWMAVGCLLNALRCHRLHCFISGPVLLIGALTAASIGTGAVDWGPHALGYVTWVAFGLALLSLAPELIWRRYA